MKQLILALALAPTIAAANMCPPVADTTAERDDIYQQLRFVETERDAARLNAQLWELWLVAPDAAAQRMLDEGIAKLRSADFLGSRDVLDDLVDYCPEYAEGYNQRAFANFLQQDFAAAAVDLERAREIDPRHLGVLTGLAMTLIALDRNDEAQEVLRQALRLNPMLSERRLLTEPQEREL